MKYCIITSFFPGATLPIVQNLKKRGHEVDLFFMLSQGRKQMETMQFDEPIHGNEIVPVKKDNRIFDYLDKSINFYQVPYYIVKNRKYLIGFIPYFKNIFIINKMMNMVKKGNYDVIYVIVNEENDSIVCRKLKNAGYKNVVIAYHEVVISHSGEPKLKKVVKETSVLGYPLITYSENVRTTLQRLTGRSDVQKFMIGPIESWGLHKCDTPLVKEPYILYIGRILPYKGLDFLYEAVKEYGNDLKHKIVIAGSGYDKVLDEMKKDDRYIVMNHFIEDSDFANLMQHASVIVCPYSGGSQSGITHAALVFETPVVTTKTAAFLEYVEDGKTGALVDYGNRQQFISAIKDILNGKNFIKGYIPEHLRWENIIIQLEELSNKITSRVDCK